MFQLLLQILFMNRLPGSYVVIAGLIATKILIAGMTAAAGSSSWGIIAVYVASNRIFTEVCHSSLLIP